MPTFEIYVPEDLMEAGLEAELARSDLDTDFSFQQPERKSSTPTSRKSWCFWKRWTSKVDFEEKEEEKGCAGSENDISPTEEDAEKIMEELPMPVKDKSITRRFLNWVDGALQNYYEKKIARTYRRELEEGNRVYRTSYMYPVWSRAQVERRKRKELIRRDERRQKIKKRLDDYWEERRQLKQELRLKEEQRYEKWMAAHGLGVPQSSPEEPKRRMSKWEKRFLRMKEFFFHQSN